MVYQTTGTKSSLDMQSALEKRFFGFGGYAIRVGEASTVVAGGRPFFSRGC
jgi:hypothetical protein